MTSPKLRAADRRATGSPGRNSNQRRWVSGVTVDPENRDEFEQKGAKITKKTTCDSEPIHLRGDAIPSTSSHISPLLCVLGALLFKFPFSSSGGFLFLLGRGCMGGPLPDTDGHRWGRIDRKPLPG